MLFNKRCPKCGKTSLEWDHVKFCSDCGVKLEDMGPLPTCECGVQISSDNKFCSACGRKNVKTSSLAKTRDKIEDKPQWWQFWRWFGPDPDSEM